MKDANSLCASSSQPGVRGFFLSHASPSQPGVRFGFSFSVSLCASPSQPGVRSVCFCAHPRLNQGCVLVFRLVCLCAHLRLNLGCVVFFCAHLRLNLGCVVTCKNSIIAISTSVDRVAQRSGEIHVHTKTVASHTDRKNADERKEPHQPRA